jgi:hypothetical protein
MTKWIACVALAMAMVTAGCTENLPGHFVVSSDDQLALSRAERQCQVVGRHAQFIAKDSITGKASFQCVD